MSTDKETTTTQIIRRKDGLTLVQWVAEDGHPHRAWVVDAMIEAESGHSAEVLRPEEGIQYGVDFWRMVAPTVTPHAIDKELKRRGIWTIEEMRLRRNEAVAALMSAYGLDYAALLRSAERYEQELGDNNG